MPLVGMHVVLPVTLIGVLILCFAAVLSHRSTFYRNLVDSEIAGSRFHSVDGLRGYLALGVAFHHLTLNYEYYRMGEWGRAPSNLSAFLGKGSVALFFMITGFLFWNRAMDTEGGFRIYAFYRSRLRRILPMYLVAVLLLVLTALAMTGLTLQVSLLHLMRSIFAWVLFTFPGEMEINGYEHTRLINTVFWSLVWEWKFYLILPVLAVFSGPRYRWYILGVVALLLLIFDRASFAWFFCGGALAAMLTRLNDVKSVARTRGASLAAFGLIAVSVVYVPYARGLSALALLVIPFAIISGGNTLFGLLIFRPARLLGVLSYSVYLLHNWVLFVISNIVNRYVSLEKISEPAYWGLGAVIVVATVTLASVTYRFIENPYLTTRAHPADVVQRKTTHLSYEFRQPP